MENILTMHSHRPLSAHTCTASITLERCFHGWGAHTKTKDWNLTRCAGLDCQSKSAASARPSALVLQDQSAQLPWQQWMLSVRRCAFRASKRPPRRGNVPTEALGRREMISGAAAAAAAIFPVFTAAPAAVAETPTRCHFPNLLPMQLTANLQP